jgi:translation initiation factor IF-3
VRVIGGDGSQVGILPTYEALKMAEEQGMELVEVNPRAAPPVCRIMDFGKFKYENSKKEKASRKHQSTVVVKEIKFRPKTDDHDLDFKVKHIRRFLAEGNKCRLVIVFRGREIVHPETGQAMLDQVIKALGDAAVVEQRASMEGRRMVLTLGPRVGVVRPSAPGISPSTGAPTPTPGVIAPRPHVRSMLGPPVNQPPPSPAAPPATSSGPGPTGPSGNPPASAPATSGVAGPGPTAQAPAAPLGPRPTPASASAPKPKA